MSMDNGAEKDRERDGLTTSSTISRSRSRADINFEYSRLPGEDAEDRSEWRRRTRVVDPSLEAHNRLKEKRKMSGQSLLPNLPFYQDTLRNFMYSTVKIDIIR